MLQNRIEVLSIYPQITTLNIVKPTSSMNVSEAKLTLAPLMPPSLFDIAD
jgi:hypothetical protein